LTPATLDALRDSDRLLTAGDRRPFEDGRCRLLVRGALRVEETALRVVELVGWRRRLSLDRREDGARERPGLATDDLDDDRLRVLPAERSRGTLLS